MSITGAYKQAAASLLLTNWPITWILIASGVMYTLLKVSQLICGNDQQFALMLACF